MWLWEEQGGLLGPFSFLLLLVLVVTRSPFNACLLTGSFYILLRFFSFEPVSSRRALQVLKPRGRISAIAHRGGSHDAPENTLAAIRQATDALKKTYMEFPQLYNNSIVCSFLPEVIYKMRQADQNVVTALTHRPWSLSHTGDGKPRFDCFWKQSVFVIMDIMLDWSMHNILWYLCGISAFLMQKDFVSPAYLKKWSAKGIQVVAWTVNTFDEKSYYESHLGSSYITDSMLEDCASQF
ncbi:glycerophosphodiester phosphodiesterase 1 isoform X2 [Tamandua tetradactyla]|uniref:glycerophosphodiester phosphodiesterase 1 isoform X2 n=1 Tax=Tamandua tetradactyla TaxID=48850 RepID=UPI0040538971